MNLRKWILVVFALILTICFLSSCSWQKRNPLEIAHFTEQLLINAPSQLVLQFKESVPGKPLDETVWDNVSGPFWDIKESNQIGFTQNYKPQAFFIPPILLPAAAKAGVNLTDTRIIVPFGKIFSGVFSSAIQKNIKRTTVCFKKICTHNLDSSNLLIVKIENFYVWEAPLNHLNLYAKGKSVYSQNVNKVKEYQFEKSLLSQKLGSVLSTHNTFMKAMNRLSNQFAVELTTEIIEVTLN